MRRMALLSSSSSMVATLLRWIKNCRKFYPCIWLSLWLLSDLLPLDIRLLVEPQRPMGDLLRLWRQHHAGCKDDSGPNFRIHFLCHRFGRWLKTSTTMRSRRLQETWRRIRHRHLPQTAPVFNKLYLSVKWTLNCPSTCISITMLTVGFSDATPVF